MVGRDDLARLRGTPAHREALLAMQRALGLIADDAPPPPPPLAQAAEVERELPEPIPFPVRPAPDPQPVEAWEPLTPTEGEALAIILTSPRDPEREGKPPPTPRTQVSRDRLAALKVEWETTKAYAAGVPFLTCLRYPSPTGQREHHIHWRLVYWLDAGETRTAWRCLKCYPELERITSARIVEQRIHEHLERLAALGQA